VCAALTAAGWPTTANAMTRTRPDGTTLRWRLAMLAGLRIRRPLAVRHRLGCVPIPLTARRAPVD
jgi:hypothetical protein